MCRTDTWCSECTWSLSGEYSEGDVRRCLDDGLRELADQVDVFALHPGEVGHRPDAAVVLCPPDRLVEELLEHLQGFFVEAPRPVGRWSEGQRTTTAM